MSDNEDTRIGDYRIGRTTGMDETYEYYTVYAALWPSYMADIYTGTEESARKVAEALTLYNQEQERKEQPADGRGQA